MMVLGGVGWDRKEFPESNLHMYGKDDTKIIVYNMERWPKERGHKIKITTFRALSVDRKKKITIFGTIQGTRL